MSKQSIRNKNRICSASLVKTVVHFKVKSVHIKLAVCYSISVRIQQLQLIDKKKQTNSAIKYKTT